MVTADSVRDAGIAAHLAVDPAVLPEPSIYFQDFNFGGTMFDALFGNAEALGGVGAGISDVALEERMALEAEDRKKDDPAGDASMITELAERQRADLQRISVGGIDLSAEEWDNVRENLSDPATLAIIEDRLRAQGKTEAEIQQGVYLARVAADIAEKRGNGLPLTAEERAVEQRLQSDPEARRLAQDVAEIAREAPETVAQNELTNDQVQNAETEQIGSTDAYLEAREQFASQNGYDGTEAVEYAETALAVRDGISNAGNPFADTRSPNSEFNAQAAGDVRLAQATPVQTAPTISAPTLLNG